MSGGAVILLIGAACAFALPAVAGSAPSSQYAGETCHSDGCWRQYLVSKRQIGNGTFAIQIRSVFLPNTDVTSAGYRVAPQAPKTFFWKVSCDPANGYIEFENHQRMKQPNPVQSHATEVEDKVWIGVCRLFNGRY